MENKHDTQENSGGFSVGREAMNRRRVVAGLIAVFSGCSGFSGGSDADDTKRLSIDRPPKIETPGMRLTCDVENAETAGDAPLSFTLALQNTADEVRNVRLFNGYLLPYRTTRPRALYLADERMELRPANDGNWTPQKGTELTGTETMAALNHELHPGDRIEERVELWVDPRTDARQLPTGVFETAPNPVRFGSDAIENVEWTMDLEITE